jgi:ATPase subunit of ABC transporter with duplicated ATPase domains
MYLCTGSHHRVLHVKQEVASSSQSVLQVVLSADVERTALLDKEKELAEKLRSAPDEDATVQQSIMDEMADLSERMTQIGVHTAESRAATILSGLQFSDEMQQASTASLSGGWRMRVSLAGALLVEPDLLMLDEPTNHLGKVARSLAIVALRLYSVVCLIWWSDGFLSFPGFYFCLATHLQIWRRCCGWRST